MQEVNLLIMAAELFLRAIVGSRNESIHGAP